MKVAYFDCPSGAPGDMIMGALMDAGLSFEALRLELGKLGLSGYTLERREVMKCAFRATKIDVRVHGHDHPVSVGLAVRDALDQARAEGGRLVG